MQKTDVEEYEPYKQIKKDMMYKSLTTKGKYYYIYFRNGAKQFLQTLIGWKLCGHIQLCVMTAANKYYGMLSLCYSLSFFDMRCCCDSQIDFIAFTEHG